MKLSIDFDYILKRLIVIILAFVIISNLKSCEVFAQECTNCSYTYGYSSSPWTGGSITPPGTLNLSLLPNNFYFRSTSSSYNSNNHILFSIQFSYLLTGDFSSNEFDPVIEFRYGYGSNYTNISSHCTTNFTRSFVYNDSVITQTLFSVVGVCSFNGSSNNSTQITTYITTGLLNGSGSSSWSLGSISSDIGPSDVSLINHNNDKNTLSIINKISDIEYNQDIIENQLQDITNTLDDINGQLRECSDIRLNISERGFYLNSSGQKVANSNYGITGFRRVYNNTSIKIISPLSGDFYYCLYGNNNQLITCHKESPLHTIQLTGYSLVVYYVRFSVELNSNKPVILICDDNKTEIYQDFFGNSNVDGAISKYTDFFTNNNIENSFGLSSVITGPLRLIDNAVSTCSPKSFTLFQQSITLPCGTDLFWEKDFSSHSSIFVHGYSGTQLNSIRDNFRLFWNTLFGGAILFALAFKLFKVTQNALDPLSDDDYHSISSAIDTEKDYVPRHSESYHQSLTSVPGSRLEKGKKEGRYK